MPYLNHSGDIYGENVFLAFKKTDGWTDRLLCISKIQYIGHITVTSASNLKSTLYRVTRIIQSIASVYRNEIISLLLKHIHFGNEER